VGGLRLPSWPVWYGSLPYSEVAYARAGLPTPEFGRVRGRILTEGPVRAPERYPAVGG
jgi:hypothetical protein